MSDLSNLYPFLSGRRQDPVRLDEALLRSIDDKARESREMNARFFAEQGDRLQKFMAKLSPDGRDQLGDLSVSG